MFQRSTFPWCLMLACLADIAASDVALAQIGIGSWPGQPGYGGLYGGYSGYRGYEMGYPASAYGSARVYGYPNASDFSNRFGPRGLGGGLYYAPATYPTFSQPSPSMNRQRIYSPGSIADQNPNRIYTGNSPVITTPGGISSNVATTPAVIHDHGEIVLFSPPTNMIDVQYSLNGVSYSLNGVSYTMKPGSLQKFANDRTWNIDVNLGNGQHAKYTLSTGRFKFKQSDTGVGLYSTKESPEVPAPVPEIEPPEANVDDPTAPVPMPVE